MNGADLRWHVGIDGGGGGTRMLVADRDGLHLERHDAATVNHQADPGFARNFASLLSRLEGRSIAQANFFLSGWDFPADTEILTRAVGGAIAENRLEVQSLVLDNDVFAILHSGLKGETRAVCVAAGSGMVSAAIDGTTRHRSWGFGFDSGEWGGGVEIGRQALHEVFAAALGRRPPCPVLSREVFRECAVAGARELVEAVNAPNASVPPLSRLSVAVFEAWREGCPCATAIVQRTV